MLSFSSRVFSCLAVVAAFLLAASPGHADTGLGRHKKAYAVPAPGKVTIDGKFDDWDLSGQIVMYVVSETADMQSAKFAVMYDAEALYLGAEVRDPSPMMNRHDPKVDGDKGWDADACQFRMTLDPKMGYPVNIGWGQGDMENLNLIHLTFWYYTDAKAPCLQMHSSMKYKVPRPEWGAFGVVPADLFQAHYERMADGRGYTFEYRIPWATLGVATPLKGGDLVAGTVQFDWSQADGLKTAGGSAWCYDVMSGPGFPYQSTGCWGKIIFSDKGNLPKELVEEGIAPEKPLPLKFAYRLPEDSQVTVQLFDKDGMSRRILVAQGNRRAGENIERWDGLDDQGKPLSAGEYVWKGLWHVPIRQQFLFSPHNSGQPPYATDDNTGGWGGDHGTPTTPCAFDGGVLLGWGAAEAGWGVIRCNLDGRRQWGSRQCATYIATDDTRFFTAGDHGFDQAPGVKVFALADGRPLNFGNGKPQLPAPAGGDAKSNEVTGLAYHAGTVYVAYAGRNLIGLFDAASGEPRGTWSVPAPGRLAPRPDGSLAAISTGRVVTLNAGAVVAEFAEHLDEPRGVAVAADGTLFVANAGKLQNVSVFSAAGKYLRSIGKGGGRPRLGAYDRDGMLEPGGIAVDAKGQLWVSETLDSPKRVSLWNTGDGKLINEFFGGCDYFGYSWIDPKKPDEIYCHNVIWKIDWAKNSCAPVSTLWRALTPDMMLAPGPSGYNQHPRYFTAANGHQYSYGNERFLSILSRRDGLLYRPLCAFIGINRGYVYYGEKTQFALTEDAQKYPNGSYFWQDANDDQTVQENEIVSTKLLNDKAGNPGLNWGIRDVDAHLNLWLYNGYLLRPARWDGDRPVYDLATAEPTFLVKNKQGGGEIWLDPDDGGVYTLNYDAVPSLAKWSADGKMLWGYPHLKSWPNALGLPMSAPGRLWGLTNPLGVAGNFTGNSCYFGTYHLFTRDGLYACMLMRDSRDGKGMGPDVTASETLTGQIVKLDGLPSGAGKPQGSPGFFRRLGRWLLFRPAEQRPSRYFLLAGASDARVTEIFGLDTIKPLAGGAFTITEPDARQAAAAQAEYAAKVARGKRLSIARGRPALDTADPVAKSVDDTRSFTARVAYDEKSLYFSFDVATPYDLVNASPDPRLLFKGGNCLDLQIAADPAADPKRKTPAPGDVRILVTRQKERAFSVIYRPKVTGFKGEPIVLTSPTGKESFDAIETTDRVGLEYRKTPSGYQATITVPLELLGLTLKPGVSLAMDIGVLYGNATGTAMAARSYWVNNSFSANVTNDVPNESRLEPAEWGTAVAE